MPAEAALMATIINKFEFPECMHALSAAPHMEFIEPQKVVISMPFDDWWKLHNSLQRKFRDLMLDQAYDGRGALRREFQYMGFTFRVQEPQVAKKVA
jgi:hypothetical protein